MRGRIVLSMRGLIVLLVVAGVVLAASAALAQPESVSLAFKGTPGTELAYDNLFNFEMTVTGPTPADGSAPFVLTPSLRGSARTRSLVKSVAENGDLTLGTRVDSFSLTLEAADLHLRLGLYGPNPEGRRAGYRSGQDRRGLVPAQVLKLPELPVQMVMDPRGKLLALAGLEKLIPAIPGPQGKPLDFGAYLKSVIDQFAVPSFPDRPVTVGEKWEAKLEVDPSKLLAALGVPMPPQAAQQMEALKFPLVITSTLLGFEPVSGVTCAKIETTAPWQLTMPVSTPEEKGPATALAESGSTTVTIWFDAAAGRVVRQTVGHAFDMSVTAGGAPVVTMTAKGTAQSDLVP